MSSMRSFPRLMLILLDNDDVQWFNANGMRKRIWTWACTLKAWKNDKFTWIGWNTKKKTNERTDQKKKNASQIKLICNHRTIIYTYSFMLCPVNINNFNDFQSKKSNKKKRDDDEMKPSKMNALIVQKSQLNIRLREYTLCCVAWIWFPLDICNSTLWFVSLAQSEKEKWE